MCTLKELGLHTLLKGTSLFQNEVIFFIEIEQQNLLTIASSSLYFSMSLQPPHIHHCRHKSPQVTWKYELGSWDKCQLRGYILNSQNIRTVSRSPHLIRFRGCVTWTTECKGDKGQ